MASLISRPDGSKEVQFMDPYLPETRRNLRLGKLNKTQANAVREKIEKLIASKQSDTALEAPVAAWVATMPAKYAKKLAEWKLIEPRADTATGETVHQFVDDYLSKRTDVKPRTKLNHTQARRYLFEYFDQTKKLADVTKLDAKQFRQWILDKGKSENTVRTHVKSVRLFFNAAMDDKRISENPFLAVPVRILAVPDRQRFIDGEDIKRITAKLPNAEWRALLALARYGGLRIPSEIHELKLEHIDWEANRLLIMVPKLERFAGKDRRQIPLFPELLEPLRELAENAAPGQVYVLPTLRQSSNLRTQFNRYTERAGLKPWIRPFQNMRSTRETELTEKYPLKVVSEWMGHDPTISMRNYQQVLPEHWNDAIAAPTPQRNTGAKSGAVCNQLEPVAAGT